MNQESNKILTDELSNLFKIVCNERQTTWIFESHIKSLVSKRQAANSVETLLFAVELRDSIDIDQFFKFKVEAGRTLRENDIFQMRGKYNEKELLTQLAS